MPEIESELNISVMVDVIHVLTGNAGADRIIIDPIILTKEQAATLAWLSNHVKGTKLKLLLEKE